MPRAKAESSRSKPSTSTHVPRPRPVRPAKVESAIRKAFEKVRKLSLAHPGVYEKEAWSEATFRVEKGKMFLMFADNHHDDGRVAFWCMATPDAREAWLALDDERFFVPPYVGPSGWVGVRLEGDVPWDLVEDVIAEGARLAAPKSKPRTRPR
ncbi:MAG: MmcQ/YjbR family DNA-binding protein [Polyangiaceae bacterium]|nr:MmcQ/YjbR family DNA-binding protein [Polyangiaceae bacterium]